MTNIRSTGGPPGLLPSSTELREAEASTELREAKAAAGLMALLESPPKSAPLSQTPSSNKAPAPSSPGTADFRQALAAGRSTQRNLLQSMRSDEELRHKVKEVEPSTSAGGSHGTTSAHPSTSVSTPQPGRRLAIHELLAHAETGNKSGDKPPPISGPHGTARLDPIACSEGNGKLEDMTRTMDTQDAVRSSSPSGSRMATRLHKDFQTSQARRAGEAPSTPALEIDKEKGKGKAPERRTPAESYGADDERRSPSNPLEGLTPEQHSAHASPIAEEKTTSARAASSDQTHPYMQITPHPEVVTMLAASKSLSDILACFVNSATSSIKENRSILGEFETFFNNKGITNTEALRNFYYFNSLVNDFLGERYPEPSPIKTRIISLLRSLGAEIFALPSQSKLNEIASQLGEPQTMMKLLTDASRRLDGLLASMPLAGSPYEGEHARECFLDIKHGLARRMAEGGIGTDTNVVILLHYLRRIVHGLPLDNTLNDILDKTRASLSASARKTYKVPGTKVVTTLAEIAFIKDISEEEMTFALKEWKNAKKYFLVNSELKGNIKERANEYNGQLSDRQKEVFDIINTSLNEWAPGLNTTANMNPLSSYLEKNTPKEQGPAAPSGSGNVS